MLRAHATGGNENTLRGVRSRTSTRLGYRFATEDRVLLSIRGRQRVKPHRCVSYRPGCRFHRFRSIPGGRGSDTVESGSERRGRIAPCECDASTRCLKSDRGSPEPFELEPAQPPTRFGGPAARIGRVRLQRSGLWSTAVALFVHSEMLGQRRLSECSEVHRRGCHESFAVNHFAYRLPQHRTDGRRRRDGRLPQAPLAAPRPVVAPTIPSPVIVISSVIDRINCIYRL